MLTKATSSFLRAFVVVGFLVFGFVLYKRAGLIQASNADQSTQPMGGNVSPTEASQEGNIARKTPSLVDQLHEEDLQTQDFMRGISRIDSAINEPKFGPWKDDFILLKEDAELLYGQAQSIRKKCFEARDVSSEACKSAQTREVTICSWLPALQDWDIDDSTNNERTIKPQIDKWIDSGYPEKIKKIAYYSKNLGQYSVQMDEASTLTKKSQQAGEAGDYIGGFIVLRHSQMLLDDCFIRALREFYSQK